jgi:hypothetical protein
LIEADRRVLVKACERLWTLLGVRLEEIKTLIAQIGDYLELTDPKYNVSSTTFMEMCQKSYKLVGDLVAENPLLDTELFFTETYFKMKEEEKVGKLDLTKYLDSKQLEYTEILKESQSQLLTKVEDIALLAEGFDNKAFKLKLLM